MKLYSYQGQYPQPLPFRIRLPDGSTRTEPATFTIQEIKDAGFFEVNDMPIPNSTQIVHWDYQNAVWALRNKTLEELRGEKKAVWDSVRIERDEKIRNVMWRYERYARLERLGLKQIDNISKLDNYVQALADIPQKQTDPYDIVWPILK